MYLRTDHDTMSFLRASLLQESISGFRIGQKALLKVCYVGTGKSVYHHYEGGTIWMATAPIDVGRPGRRLSVSAKLLTRSEFVRDAPVIALRNEANFSWLPMECKILRISDGRSFHIQVQQRPAVEGISRFDVPLEPAENLGFAPGKGCYLETRLWDFFGRPREVRIYHDGHSPAWVGLRQGRKHPRVSFLSFDGVRLRLAYGSPDIRVASVYLAEPTTLYSLEPTKLLEGSALDRLPWKPSSSYHIGLRRETEREMLASRYRYPHGRIGSEVAYSIASQELGFKDTVLNDPSGGGADMMASEGGVVFESRLITITEAMPRNAIERQILFELRRLRSRLRSDLRFYRSARIGYAILSFVGPDGLGTLIFRMKKR